MEAVWSILLRYLMSFTTTSSLRVHCGVASRKTYAEWFLSYQRLGLEVLFLPIASATLIMVIQDCCRQVKTWLQPS